MSLRACIPLPLQIVIDDVGWHCGCNGAAENQPYRTGFPRDHVTADYQAIVELGKALGMRPQAQMVLGEWDTQNRLRNIPTASWLGTEWNSADHNGEWMEEAAQIIRENGDFFEVGLHAIGHEFWVNGKMERAEWHDSEKRMRPRHEIEARLELFLDLVRGHRLGQEPRSLVPCAWLHHFGHPSENFAEIVQQYGITSISNPFGYIHFSRPAETPLFGFDEGLITVDRGPGEYLWSDFECRPTEIPAGSILGLHWPNLLHLDPARNGEVIERWIHLLKPMQTLFDRILSPNTDAFNVQLVHHAAAAIKIESGFIEVDASASFKYPWRNRPVAPLVLKVTDDFNIQTLELPVSADRPILNVKIDGLF